MKRRPDVSIVAAGSDGAVPEALPSDLALSLTREGLGRASLDAERSLARRAGVRVAWDAPLRVERHHASDRAVYYADSPRGGLVASTSLAQVARASGAAELCVERVATLAAWAPVASPEATLFRGISRLLPGEQLVVTARGGARVRRGRDDSAAPDLPTDPGDLAEALWTEICASVARAVGGARRVAVLAGGGVDSSALLAAALAESRGASDAEVLAVSLDFAGPGDDRPHRRALEDALGIVSLQVAPEDAGPHVQRALVMGGLPYVGQSGPLDLALAARAREAGAEVVLSGAGGDELFAGDLREVASLLLRGRFAATWRAVRGIVPPWAPPLQTRLADYVVRPLVRPLVPLRALASRARSADKASYPWAGPALLAMLGAARARNVAAQRPPPQRHDARLRAWAHDTRFLEHADLRDLIERETGLRREDPFLDARLASWVSALTIEQLNRGPRHRGLLRDAMALGGVPSSIGARTDKAHFEPAFAGALAAAGGLTALGDVARVSRLVALGIVSEAGARSLRSAIDRDPAGASSAEAWSSLWQLMSLESFLAGWGELR